MRWGRADCTALSGGQWARRHCPLGLAAGCSLPAQLATDDRPPTRQCCHRVNRKLAQSFSQREWRVGLLGLRVAGLSEVFFPPTPRCPALLSLLHLTPLSRFPANIVPITSENSRTKNKGSDGASPSLYHLPHSPKPAPEKLTPSCPEPFVTLLTPSCPLEPFPRPPSPLLFSFTT